MNKLNIVFMTTFVIALSAAIGCSKPPPSTQQTATQNEAPSPHEFDAMPELGTQARCPVMDHTFVVVESTESTVLGGKTYVFCCPGCKGNFETDPQSYLDKM